jgi:3-dehydroquinate dehydratase II
VAFSVLRVLVINGPNLNTLGWREPELYGHETLADVEALCMATGDAMGMKVDCFQANGEGEIVERIHAARGVYDGIALNAGAYTHTSIAILDALLAVSIPAVEVHLSNVYQRESFRHTSYLAKAAIGVIAGFGSNSYVLALQALNARLTKTNNA